MSTAPTRVPISKRLVLINSLSGIATRLLSVGVFAWVIQYLMKRIPEQELALLPVVISLAMILPLLQTILTSGLSRFVTEAYARNDLNRITGIVSSQLPLLVVGAIIVTVLGGVVAWHVDSILDIPAPLLGKARFMILLIVARIAIGMVLAPFNTGLYANQRFLLQNVVGIASSLLRIGLMVGLILGIGPNVEWVIVAHIASQLFGDIATSLISVRLLPALRFRAGSFNWHTAKEVVSFGGWSFLSEAANLIRRAADAPLLNIFATPVAVNDFFLGSLFETQLRQMAIAASLPLLPALTAMHAHQQNTRLAGAFLRGSRIALWMSMFLAVPLIAYSHDLFALYLGSAYREHVDAANVMIILLLGFPLTYPTMLYYHVANAKGEIRRIAILSIVSQLLNLALTLFLVGQLRKGAIGSASATLLSFAIVWPLGFWPAALHSLKIPWREFFVESLAPGFFPAGIAAVVSCLSVQLLGDSNLMRVLVGVPVSFIVYLLAMAYVFKPADRADIARMRQSIRFSGSADSAVASNMREDSSGW